MSFITRCPACSTSFKVVADQLRISQGWVRCGHCAEIFDANQDLKPWVPTPPVLTNVVDEDEQAPALAWKAPQGTEPTEVEAPNELAAWEVERPGEVAPTSAESAVEPHAFEASQEERIEPTQIDWPVETDLPIDVLKADEDRPNPLVDSADEPEPGFVRQAKRHAFWRRPDVRVGLWTAVVLSGLVLMLQWAIVERNRLAAAYPALKPSLALLCQPLSCEVGPVRALSAVVIDGSSLVRLIGQLHALDVVLRNTHSVSVAMPALELSLTNAQEQVLIRRVLLPEQWPDAPEVLSPGQAWPLKLRLSIALPDGQSMAGYRAVLFYP